MSGYNDYEKLQLSKQDISYLYGNILKNANSKLDLHLSASDNDPLKRKVANLLDEFLMKSFDMAKNSLIIDGKDMGNVKDKISITDLLSLQSKEKIAPFDFELNAQLRVVLENFEAETIKLTALRKELPQKARNMYKSLITHTDEEVSSFLSELEADDPKKEESVKVLEISPHQDSVIKNFQEAILQLQDLKNNLPKSKAQLNQFDETIKFLENAYNDQ